MRGFMCQPNASTAVCIPGDPHSVVVPRRPDRTLVDHARIADLRYSRLVDRPKLPPLTPSPPPPPPQNAPPPSKSEKIIKMIVPVSDSAEKKERIAYVARAPPSNDDRVFQVNPLLEVLFSSRSPSDPLSLSLSISLSLSQAVL